MAPYNELTVFIALPFAGLSCTLSVHFYTAINTANHTAALNPSTKTHFTLSSHFAPSDDLYCSVPSHIMTSSFYFSGHNLNQEGFRGQDALFTLIRVH